MSILNVLSEELLKYNFRFMYIIVKIDDSSDKQVLSSTMYTSGK